MIKNIAVLGAGTMGIGIALLFAEHDFIVSLYEPDAALIPTVDKKLRAIGGVQKQEKQGMSVEVFTNILLCNNLEKAVANADLIVEAVPEDLDIKRDVFNRLVELIKSDAIIASNTSTFALQTLVRNTPFADRMVITHFFNPAQLIPLVEIVGLPSTPRPIVEKIVTLMRNCGKTPIVLNKDIPGFIANRLQAALMREACYLLENGVADAQQIDTAVKDGLGLRWAFKGPFEIADLGGLDVWAKVTGHLFPELGISTDSPESLQKRVRSGELGVKSSKGYYDYEDPSGTVEQMNDSLLQLVSLKAKRIERDEHGENK
jgi:3-hydroxybutyryl-CoA dehydrogenase